MTVDIQSKRQAVVSKKSARQHDNKNPVSERPAFTHSTSDALSMRVEFTEPAQSGAGSSLPASPTHVVRLSCDELRFDHSDLLEPAQRIWVHMRLLCSEPGQSAQVVVTAADVISSDSKKDHAGNKCYDTRVRFTNCDQRFQMIVQNHIEDVVAKLCKNCRQYTYVPGGLTHTAA